MGKRLPKRKVGLTSIVKRVACLSKESGLFPIDEGSPAWF